MNKTEEIEKHREWFKEKYPFIALEQNLYLFADRVYDRMQKGAAEATARYLTLAEIRRKNGI